jgi:hypothetical protein
MLDGKLLLCQSLYYQNAKKDSGVEAPAGASIGHCFFFTL